MLGKKSLQIQELGEYIRMRFQRFDVNETDPPLLSRVADKVFDVEMPRRAVRVLFAGFLGHSLSSLIVNE